MRLSVFIGLLVGAFGAFAGTLSPIVQDMFDAEMDFLDNLYDETAGYLWYFYYPLAAGPHETRSSVWYSVGLLQRNADGDVDKAVKIINGVIAGQFKNASEQWYGDYTVYPEQPTVGSPSYAPVVRSERERDTTSSWLTCRSTTHGIPTGAVSSARRS